MLVLCAFWLLLASLVRPRAREHARHRIVPFVASILDYRPLDPVHGNLRGPAPRERRGVVHRELVQDRLRPRTLELFDELQVFVRTTEAVFVGEIRGLHHQRIAFPAPTRIAEPLAHIGGKMWTAV